MAGFDDLSNTRYVSLVTYRKTGEAVATPVWFVVGAGRGNVYTGQKTGKLKRIMSDPRVQVAPCSLRGKVKGSYRSGVARVLDGSQVQPVRAAFASKYGLQWRFVIRRGERGGASSSAFIQIAPDERAG
jgi:uncharacterized protein